MYYVSVIDGKKYGLLDGPYKTKKQAEKAVPVARAIAYDLDDKAWFYAYGTCKAQTDRPGVLNGKFLPMRSAA